MPLPSYRVLIIEDSPTIRHVTSHQLSEEGLNCDGAESAEEGLRLLEQARAGNYPFDVVLLDWNLPELRGAEALMKIRNNPKYQNLAIMVYSENPDEEAYRLSSLHPYNDIQLKSESDKLPARLRRFITLCKAREGAPLNLEDTAEAPSAITRILFVDDSPTVRAKYYELLTANGYQVELAENMEEGLDTARRFHPDIAIIDYFMPGGNGDELTRALLEGPKTSDITCVILSQRNDVVEKALEAGAVDLIWKDEPVHVFLMRINAIATLIAAQRRARQLEVFQAATELIGLGVIIEVKGEPQPYNSTMEEYAASCNGLAAFVDGGGADGNGLIHIKDNDGRDRYFQKHSLTLEDPDRIILVQDITDRKEQELEILQARKMVESALEEANAASMAKSTFLSTMSHELRTPLNAIIGFSDMMCRQLLGPIENPQYVEYANDIGNSGRHLLSLVNDVLDMSKVEAGETKAQLDNLDVVAVIDDVFTMMREIVADRDILLQIQAPPEPPTVMADERMTKQILINLLSNAVKFSPGGGTVTVEVTEVEDMISVAVVDRGIGMEPEDILRALKPFVQIERENDQHHQGTGLGLPICKSFAELQGGALKLASERGKGTTATFTLARGNRIGPGG